MWRFLAIFFAFIGFAFVSWSNGGINAATHHYTEMQAIALGVAYLAIGALFVIAHYLEAIYEQLKKQ